MEALKYFEVVLSEHGPDDCNAVWMCIRGINQPTIAETQRFLARDVEKYGLPVAGVYPIDEDTARDCYDFSYETKWPVFQ